MADQVHNGPVEEVLFCPAISGSEPVAINLYNDASYRGEPLKFHADRRIADEQKQEAAVECDGQPLQINGRSGQEGLDAHIVQSSAHRAGEAVPCLGFAMQARPASDDACAAPSAMKDDRR